MMNKTVQRVENHTFSSYDTLLKLKEKIDRILSGVPEEFHESLTYDITSYEDGDIEWEVYYMRPLSDAEKKAMEVEVEKGKAARIKFYEEQLRKLKSGG